MTQRVQDTDAYNLMEAARAHKEGRPLKPYIAQLLRNGHSAADVALLLIAALKEPK